MNRVIHFEIHAENPERAVAFYTKVFGWDIKKWGDGGDAWDYWMIVTGKDSERGINGGLLKRRGAGPLDMAATNAFVCTIDVESVDAIKDTILQAGGSEAAPKMPVPGIGWLAYFKDTEGNIFGTMQNDLSAK